MLTAEEFFKEKGTLKIFDGYYTNDTSLENIIEFTRMHVNSALESVLKNVGRPLKGSFENDQLREDILESYSLTNIK